MSEDKKNTKFRVYKEELGLKKENLEFLLAELKKLRKGVKATSDSGAKKALRKAYKESIENKLGKATLDKIVAIDKRFKKS